MPVGVASCLLTRRHTSVSVSPCLCSRQKERERATEVLCSSQIGVDKQPCRVCNRQGKGQAIHRGMQVKTCACLPFVSKCLCLCMVLWARDATLQRLQRHATPVTPVSQHQQLATTNDKDRHTHCRILQVGKGVLPDSCLQERCLTPLLLVWPNQDA